MGTCRQERSCAWGPGPCTPRGNSADVFSRPERLPASGTQEFSSLSVCPPQPSMSQAPLPHPAAPFFQPNLPYCPQQFFPWPVPATSPPPRVPSPDLHPLFPLSAARSPPTGQNWLCCLRWVSAQGSILQATGRALKFCAGSCNSQLPRPSPALIKPVTPGPLSPTSLQAAPWKTQQILHLVAASLQVSVPVPLSWCQDPAMLPRTLPSHPCHWHQPWPFRPTPWQFAGLASGVPACGAGAETPWAPAAAEEC